MNVVIGNHKNSFKNQASKQGPILTQNARGGEREKKFKNSEILPNQKRFFSVSVGFLLIKMKLSTMMSHMTAIQRQNPFAMVVMETSLAN